MTFSHSLFSEYVERRNMASQACAYSNGSGPPKPNRKPFSFPSNDWGSDWKPPSDSAPSWSPGPSANISDGLLPHERAARDGAARRQAAASPSAGGPAESEPPRNQPVTRSRNAFHSSPFSTPSNGPGRGEQPATPQGKRAGDQSKWGQLRRRDSAQDSTPILWPSESRPARPNAGPRLRDDGREPRHGKDWSDVLGRPSGSGREEKPRRWREDSAASAAENTSRGEADISGRNHQSRNTTIGRQTDDRSRDWGGDRYRVSDRNRGRRPDKSRGRGDRQQRYEAWDDHDPRDDEVFEERRRRKEEKKAQREREKLSAQAGHAGPTPILLPQFISVSNLAVALKMKQDVFIRQLGELGFEDINHESIMTGETAALVAEEYGFEPSVDIGEGVDLKPRPPPSDPSSLPPRPPVVTIMGHVDHGKTTLLDYLRKTSVAAQEHGGITQHIGAFSVQLSSGKRITFLDTPGHAAFLTMRQRGANVTDIVILVVAADDSVKPQTIEALKHAKAAKVPIIVAINKVDKDQARVDLVKSDLAKNGVEIEDFGGDVQVVCVSGKTGQGMSDLEENIVLLSEILDMRAEADGMAEGWVLESTVKPIGRVATVLVKRGTLRKGDCIVAGTVWARVRTLRNEAGVEIDEASPGTPVEVLGWKEPPNAGDQVLQAPDEAKAKEAIRYREEVGDREKAVADIMRLEREKREREVAAAAVEAAEADAEAGVEPGDEKPPGPKIINFIVKGDVHGSVEAVCAAVGEIGNHEVQAQVLRSAPGQVTEWDVDHAATSGSVIINFNNPIPGNVKRLADNAGVRVLDHNIIYRLVDEIKTVLSEHLAPTLSSRVLGEADVLKIFPINIRGRVYKNIAGCRVRNGQVTRSAKYRLLRRGEKVFEGTLDALKHVKKDVQEVRKGTECGISFVEWEDIQEGDLIQAFEEISTKRQL